MQKYSTDNIKIKILRKDAIIPTLKHGSRVISFYIDKDQIVKPNARSTVSLGFVMSFNSEHILKIDNDPIISQRNGIFIVSELIESTTENEFTITIENSCNSRIMIEKGKKIAEGILIPSPFTQIQVVRGL